MVEIIMGTIRRALAAAQDTAEHSGANGLAATLKRWWLAWRIEQAAIAQLRSKSDLELNDIRRHPDGSIDIDFYRTRAVTLRAVTLRGQARRGASALKAFGALVRTIVGMVAVFFAVAPAPPRASNDQAALAQTKQRRSADRRMLRIQLTGADSETGMLNGSRVRAMLSARAPLACRRQHGT
jgi:hypothetical protein